MKKGKVGFLLIEWMVHFLLMSMLLLIATTLILSWHKNVQSTGRLCDDVLAIYLAADALRNDVHNAHLIIYDAKELRIESPHTIFSWQYYDNELWRQTLLYQLGSWNKPFKSLFVRHICKSEFVIKALSEASQAVLISWYVNKTRFLFSSRNGLFI